jgi:hypothetical protein
VRETGCRLTAGIWMSLDTLNPLTPLERLFRLKDVKGVTPSPRLVLRPLGPFGYASSDSNERKPARHAPTA